MNDKLTAWLRTVVPGAWSALVAYLVSIGTPQFVTDALGAAFEPVVYPLVLAGVYAGLRAIEPKLPVWTRKVLLGGAAAPVYTKQ